MTGPLGYSRNAVSRAVARGHLHRVGRGVLVVGHLNLPPRGECLAAVLACAPGALLSHASAAWLWGIAKRGPRPIAITARRWRKPRSLLLAHGDVVSIETHEARGLNDADRGLVDRIPVTSVARTLLDCAASEPFDLLQRFLERTEELKLFDLHDVDDLLCRNRGHPGRGSLTRAIELYRPTSFSRSRKERRLLALLRDGGLPQPHSNYVEAGCELDFYWPELRFAVELDLFETHGSRAAFERDRKRQEDLKLAGIELVRVTGRRLEREPERVIERICRLLDQRAAEIGRAPGRLVQG